MLWWPMWGPAQWADSTIRHFRCSLGADKRWVGTKVNIELRTGVGKNALNFAIGISIWDFCLHPGTLELSEVLFVAVKSTKHNVSSFYCKYSFRLVTVGPVVPQLNNFGLGVIHRWRYLNQGVVLTQSSGGRSSQKYLGIGPAFRILLE